MSLASLRLILISILLATPSLLHAQTTVPALFLSDIHLDPFHDPEKVARLNAAPASAWGGILGEPDSSDRAASAVTLNRTCPTRGADTTAALWQSALHGIHGKTTSNRPEFITISGDLLAHSFDCKYKALLPRATHADYVSFTGKTMQYVLSSLRATLPSVPIYLALGNNDSACSDYELAPAHDELLALVAQIAAETLPAPERPEVLATFPATGSYAVPLAGVPNTEIIVLDDLFLSSRYATCGGAADPAPAAAQLDWLKAKLASAREHHRRVWIMGHIPPGIDLYSTARKLANVCAGIPPVMFLHSGDLAEVLAGNSDVIRLALFGHTHSDEFQLLEPSEPPTTQGTAGVPVKLTASITPVNGNRPTFTVATVDRNTADLKDFTVYKASNSNGVATVWTPEYTYSAVYHQPEFDSKALKALITGFQADRKAETAASQAYLRNYFPGDISSLIQFAWPEYACSMDHMSPSSFAACVCPAKQP